MLKVYTLAALLAIGGATAPLFAQEEVKNTTAVQSELARGYIRPSVTLIFMGDKNTYPSVLRDKRFDQCYYNIIDEEEDIPEKLLILDQSEFPKGVKKRAEEIFKKYKVSQKIMHCWFPQFNEAENAYSLDTLARRAAFAATDSDILTAEASKRGRYSRLMTLAEQMINHSYVIVVYCSSHGNNISELRLRALLYKLDFGPEVSTNFYTNGFNSADGIDKIEFPLNFIGQTKKASVILSDKEGENIERYDDVYRELFTRLSQVNADFRVKTPILKTKPLRAKIGLKESLQADDRFYVMEQVLQSNGKIKDVRRAVVRVVYDEIADNRKNADGHSEEYTSFYQVAGGKYDKGMTLVSKKDYGISFIPFVSSNFVGLEAEKRFFGLNGFFIYGRIGVPMTSNRLDPQKYNIAKFNFTVGGRDHSSKAMQYGVGIRSEYNFARFLNFSWSLGGSMYLLGYPLTELKEEDLKQIPEMIPNAYTLNLGSRFGVQMTPTFGIFVGADYSPTFGGNASLIKDQMKINPFSVSLGVRYSY